MEFWCVYMEDKKVLLSNQREFSTPFCSISLHECKCHDCSTRLSPFRLPRRLELNMRYTVIFMTGLGFFFGILVGLLIQLPGMSVPSNYEELQQTINIHYSAVNQGGAGAVIDKRMVAPLSNEELVIGSYRTDKGLSRPQETESAVVQYTNNSLALKETPHPDAPYLELEKSKVLEPESGTALPLDTEVHLTLTIPVNRINGRSSDNDLQKVKSSPPPPSVSRKNLSLSDIVDGVYWRSSVEDACVMGFSEEKRASWRRKASNLQIIKMEEGCGRMQNRLLTFRDSSKACARYRLNTDQIQGDIFSYYLSRLLKIKNLAPSIAIAVQTKHSRWSEIHLDIAQSQWMDDQVVVLSQWIADLQPTFIPKELRGEGLELHPVADLTSKSDKELCELAQWSDLIIFDYLVANLDRVVNNMFNKQWNANMMKNPTHNLLKIPSNQQLVFLDNESGLFHGYRLLDKYHVYHETMLKSLCIFRKSTVEALKKLFFAGNVGEVLRDTFVENESYHYLIPSMPEKNIKILKERLAEVYHHIKKCEQRYS